MGQQVSFLQGRPALGLLKASAGAASCPLRWLREEKQKQDNGAVNQVKSHSWEVVSPGWGVGGFTDVL